MFLLMFVSMLIIHLLIMPWFMIDSRDNFRISRNQIYAATFMATCMVVVEAIHNPLPMWGWLVVFGLFVFSISGMKFQVAVEDSDYLEDMIPHHSMAVLTSKAVLKKTRNPEIRHLAQGILQSQTSEIAIMKSLLLRQTS